MSSFENVFNDYALHKEVYVALLAGLIHQTVILKSIGNLFWHIGDPAATRQFAQQALGLADKAGLVHQSRQLKKDFKLVL